MNKFQNINKIKVDSNLYIISTPIGNLYIYKSIKNLIIFRYYIEDTRITKKLLKNYDIKPPKLMYIMIIVMKNIGN